MNDMTYFDRLVASTRRIARHSWHPGKEKAIELAVEDINDLLVAGRISVPQRDVLRGILLGGRSNAA
ncbi:hypothetical protein [Tautonia plasticadhaerens]|uniref:Uncharacterized protein n=1 Tax=Tautonia plasticadhaerens TaxID=2527974 RepID=A0A518HEK9_9BACT|nr:hypothetical protein [Tautonia plasticadhaerens]QDV39283.1 hypothetical protein ElP_72470 [Tautonia plasticadhaerens]